MASIQGIYIALFGRPADPEGLEFWTMQTKGGTDLSFLVGRLTAADEYEELVAGKTPTQVINAIYQQLYGRDADATGLAHYLAELNSGRQSIETIAINILDGTSGSDLLTLNAKIDAANLFTAGLDLDVEIDAYAGNTAETVGREFIADVDGSDRATQEEVDAAIQRLLTPEGEAPQEPTNPGNPGGGGGGAGGGDDVDRIPPAAPIITGFAENGSPDSNGATKDTTPTLSGTAEANSSVRIFQDGVQIGSAPVDASGNWSFDVPALGEGNFVFTARAADLSLNVSEASAPISIVVDTTNPIVPTVTLSEAADGTVSGVAEPGSSVTVNVNGVETDTAADDQTGNYSLSNAFGTESGEITVSVSSTDAAGNVSSAGDIEIYWVAENDPVDMTALEAVGLDFYGPGSVTVNGSAGDQTITVLTSGGNTINGGGGADIITGGAGNDIIIAGDLATVSTTPVIVTPGGKETFTFTILGSQADGFTSGIGHTLDNGSISFDFPAGGPSDFSVEYNTTTSNNSVSEVASLIRTQLQDRGYAVDVAISTVPRIGTDDVRAVFTATAETTGDKPNVTISETGPYTYSGFARTNGTADVTTPAVTTAIVSEASIDELTGGAGADTFVIRASYQGALDHITDFNVAQGDKIDFGTNVDFKAVAVTGASLSAMVNDAIAKLGDGEATTFVYDTRTYVVFDNDNDGSFENGLDQLVDITGVNGALTDASFVAY